MSTLKKQYISPNSVDGTKILLSNNEPLKAKDSSGTPQNLLKLDTSGNLSLESKVVKNVANPVDNNDATNKSWVSSAVASASGAVDQIDGHLETPTNKTYTLRYKAKYAATINSLDLVTASGTCTVAVTINGTNVTGLSSVSGSIVTTSATASGANSVSVGDRISLVITNNSTAVDLVFSLKLTRT